MSTHSGENEVLAAYTRACNEMDRLTSAPGGPGQSWRWSIPADLERDSDLIFADALKHIPVLTAALGRIRALNAETAQALAEEVFRHSWEGSDERRVDGAWIAGLCCECGAFVPYGSEVEHMAASLAPLLTPPGSPTKAADK